MSKSKSPDDRPILEDQLGLGDDAVQVKDKAETPEVDELGLPAEPEKKKMVDLRPWYKQPKTWAKVAGSLVVLGLLTFGGLIWYGRTQDTQTVSDQWQAVGESAERATSEVSRSSYDSFDSARQALVDMSDKLDDIRSKNKAHFLGDAKLVESFDAVLGSMKSYTDQAKEQAGNIGRLSTSDLDSLKSSSTAAKLAVEDFQKSSSLTKTTTITGDFFLLNERFERLIKAHTDAEDTKKAAADAALSKEEQAKQDKADAEEAASRWTQAYIAGSVADMKKYMTAPFAKEYDFTQVTASWRSTNYPKTYRRVSTDKKSDSYEIVETVTFITKSDYTAENSYTTTYVFLITQDATSKKWLINSQRYQ